VLQGKTNIRLSLQQGFVVGGSPDLDPCNTGILQLFCTKIPAIWRAKCVVELVAFLRRWGGHGWMRGGNSAQILNDSLVRLFRYLSLDIQLLECSLGLHFRVC
jgi:hypothetical protein